MPKISFHSTHPGLEDIDALRPVRLIDDIPEWFKDMPRESDLMPTAKQCPSFVDLFRSAYVLKAWCDMEFTFFPRENRWEWSRPSNLFEIDDSHPRTQLLDHLPTDKWVEVIKPSSPWMCETPKGYSTYQLDYPFNFNNDFDVWPGVTHNDIYHETNVQLFIKKKSDDPFVVNIMREQPLALIVPFRREQWDLEVTGDGQKYLSRSSLVSTTKFKNAYRQLTKGWIK
jgi:hypothetical protein